MRQQPNYEILFVSSLAIILRDLGPWDKYPTITNGAEEVIDSLRGTLIDQRLFYYDSEGVLTELLLHNRRFAGFAHAAEIDLDEASKAKT